MQEAGLGWAGFSGARDRMVHLVPAYLFLPENMTYFLILPFSDCYSPVNFLEEEGNKELTVAVFGILFSSLCVLILDNDPLPFISNSSTHNRGILVGGLHKGRDQSSIVEYLFFARWRSHIHSPESPGGAMENSWLKPWQVTTSSAQCTDGPLISMGSEPIGYTQFSEPRWRAHLISQTWLEVCLGCIQEAFWSSVVCGLSGPQNAPWVIGEALSGFWEKPKVLFWHLQGMFWKWGCPHHPGDDMLLIASGGEVVHHSLQICLSVSFNMSRGSFPGTSTDAKGQLYYCTLYLMYL